MSKYCVLPGTKITLSDYTTKSIEDIKINDELIVFDLNTIKKTHNIKLLKSIKVKEFNGLFTKSNVKNIWRNTTNCYYFINNKLKITNEHFILVNRNDLYYWTTVDKLLLNDHLFTINNIFEKIETITIIKEKTKVFSLEVNDYYNYFSDNILIHNSSCESCSAECGGGNGTIVFSTNGFKVYSDNSAHSSKLIGTTASTSNSGSGNTSNRRVKLSSTQSSSYPYSIILLTPDGGSSSDSPGLIVDRTNSNAVDEATVWFKVVNHNGYNQIQKGIIKKDNTLTWSQQLAYLDDKHATYADRMCFHGAGFHNYVGSRDDLTSSTSIVSPAYEENSSDEEENDGTYGSNISSNYHNIIGKTAGTMRSQSGASSNAGGSNYWFFTNSYYNYNTYRANNILSNHGLKIKWYTTTLDVSFTSDSSEITPQSGTWSESDLNNIFSGMYISNTTNVSLTNGVFIGKVYTDSITMYQETDVSSLTEITASTSGNDTITISGYLYWTLATTATYSDPVILGPPHAILPRYYADSAGGTPSSITEWSFFIGDTSNSRSNTFEYDIRDSEPSGTTFSYSVSYSTKPISINYYWKYYAFGSNIGTTYVYWLNSNTYTLNILRTITGQQHSSSGKTWNSYTEDLSSYVGETGYIIYAYKTGNSYRQDIQFDEMSIEIDGSTTTLAPDSGLWLRKTNYTTSLSYSTVTWSSISTSTSTANIWNLDAGGTPSGSTATTTDASDSSTGKYLYFEGSSPNYSSSTRYYWFRSKNTFTLTSGGGA